MKEFEDSMKSSTIDNILPSELKELNKYKEILDAFSKISDFNSINKDFEILLDKYDFDLFLIMALNKVMSNLSVGEDDGKELYTNYCDFLKIILKNKNYNEELKELLSLFFDLNIFKKKY